MKPKQPVKRSKYWVFVEENRRKISTKYPFLKQNQVLAKVTTLWKKLSRDDRVNYSPQKTRKFAAEFFQTNSSKSTEPELVNFSKTVACSDEKPSHSWNSSKLKTYGGSHATHNLKKRVLTTLKNSSQSSASSLDDFIEDSETSSVLIKRVLPNTDTSKSTDYTPELKKRLPLTTMTASFSQTSTEDLDEDDSEMAPMLIRRRENTEIIDIPINLSKEDDDNSTDEYVNSVPLVELERNKSIEMNAGEAHNGGLLCTFFQESRTDDAQATSCRRLRSQQVETDSNFDSFFNNSDEIFL